MGVYKIVKMESKIEVLDESFKKDGKFIEVLKPQDLTNSINNVKKEIIPHFSKDEILFLLSKVKPNYELILFQFLWRTGCRVSEALNIRKCDIDFVNDEMTIRWLKSRKYSYRTIFLHSSLKNFLAVFVMNLKSEDLLFPISRQRVHQLARKYGFNNPHKLRHSFAVNFLRQSDRPMAIVELKEILGHANIKSTMEYLRVVPLNQKKALELIKFD